MMVIVDGLLVFQPHAPFNNNIVRKRARDIVVHYYRVLLSTCTLVMVVVFQIGYKLQIGNMQRQLLCLYDGCMFRLRVIPNIMIIRFVGFVIGLLQALITRALVRYRSVITRNVLEPYRNGVLRIFKKFRTIMFS